MRCTILAVGTRGDVQPVLTLGAGLRAAGVSVSVATQRDFSAAVTGQGLEFRLVRGQSAAFFGGRAGNRFRDSNNRPEAFARFYAHYLSLSFERILDDFWAASRDADVVIAGLSGGASLAERLGVPVFIASIFPPPHLPTGAFPNPFPFGDAPSGGGWLANRRSWRANTLRHAIGMPSINKWRAQTLGLTAIEAREDLRRQRRLPHLGAYSPSVVPRPRDWPADVHITGYWFNDATQRYTPPPALQAFLDSGPPPVAIGFSSQVGTDASGFTTRIIEAVSLAGLRAVLVAGLGGLTSMSFPPFVHAIESIPYDWLFPRVSAVVHHGGAGSTGLAVRHGTPQVIVPFGYDQQFWGDRICELGLGPPPIPAAQVTAEHLAAAMRAAVGTEAMRARAIALASRVQAEDGLANAVRLVLEAVDRHRRQPTA